MRENGHIQLARGGTKEKCTTITAAEMLVAAGTKVVLLAFPVGPSIHRVAVIVERHNDLAFLVAGLNHLDGARRKVMVPLDIDTGVKRIGLAAEALYEGTRQLRKRCSWRIHVYDG